MANYKGKVGGTDLATLIGIGVAKPFVETAIAQTPIGNGNLMSGLVKAGGGYAVSKYAGGGKIADIGSIALFVDGVEDIMANFGILSALRNMGSQAGGMTSGGQDNVEVL